jgi:hypothetical protein
MITMLYKIADTILPAELLERSIITSITNNRAGLKKNSQKTKGTLKINDFVSNLAKFNKEVFLDLSINTKFNKINKIQRVIPKSTNQFIEIIFEITCL